MFSMTETHHNRSKLSTNHNNNSNSNNNMKLYNGTMNITTDEDNFELILYNIVTPILFSSISIVGVLGNSLVIYVIASNSKLRTVINLLLLNLAITDLSFALLVPPSTAIYLAESNWPFGGVACKMMHYLVNVSAYVTVYTLVLISAIRFLTIVRGLNTAAWKTRKIIVGMLPGMWILWLVLNAPILYVYNQQFNEDTNSFECSYENTKEEKNIFITFFVFAYVLPLACIGLLSVGILRHIEKNKPTCGPMLANHRKTRSGIKKRQASRLLILVVVMFAVSWLPVQIHLLYCSIYGIPDNVYYDCLTILFQALAYCNSCVNPIIYNHTSRDFREVFRQALGRCFCCCPTMKKFYSKNGATHYSAAPGDSVSGRKKKEMNEMKDLNHSKFLKVKQTENKVKSKEIEEKVEDIKTINDGTIIISFLSNTNNNNNENMVYKQELGDQIEETNTLE